MANAIGAQLEIAAADRIDVGIAEPSPCRTIRRSAAARESWRAARAFQVAAQKELRNVFVPFIQWLLLEALAELIAERQDAVSQCAVAERAGLSRMVTSRWMIFMSDLGLVDRGPDADGRAYRIWMTELGAETLRVCNDRLEARRLI